MPSTLYVCYFGVREPLVQTQVLPYLREIKKGEGMDRVSIVTFEPNPMTVDEADEIRRKLAETGIEWHWLRYHKRPPVISTLYDIFRGVIFVRSFIAREKPDILHGRVHVPTFMAAIARRLSSHRPKLLFDIRGFFPEEYVDAGIWPAGGWLYRGAKRVERWLVKEADGFVILTHRGKEIFFPDAGDRSEDSRGRPVQVIPCCVDVSRFAGVTAEAKDPARSQLGIPGDRFVIAYVGAFGGWYMAKETADMLAASRRRDPSTYALIITHTDPRQISDLLDERGFTADDYLIRKVDPSDIPLYLSAADVAVSFIKPAYSKQASSPTKNAEYLAAGLPIIANPGVGDTDSLIEDHRVGVLVGGFDDAGYEAALAGLDLDPETRERCKTTAANEFDLETVGGARYRRLYSKLLDRDES